VINHDIDPAWLNDRSEFQQNWVHGLRNPSGLHLQYELDGSLVFTHWTPGDDHAGFPGFAHGGIISAVLDDVMGRCSALHRHWVVTGRLEVRFRRAAPLGTRLRVEGRITRLQRRVLQTEGRVAASRRRRGRRCHGDIPAALRRPARADGGRLAWIRGVPLSAWGRLVQLLEQLDVAAESALPRDLCRARLASGRTGLLIRVPCA
jgi:acyl-coenzyme A thioesterase PaaI-like protein